MFSSGRKAAGALPKLAVFSQRVGVIAHIDGKFHLAGAPNS